MQEVICLMKSIGFIGLGIMGGPMTANLLRKGYAVTVYNRNAAKLDEYKKLGADIVSTPAEVARTVDVLFTMVSDNQAIEEIYFGEEGITFGLRPGLIVFDCSTVSPEVSRRLHTELAMHYVDFFDAPVTGSQLSAIEGILNFMVGGNKELLEENKSILLAMGKNVHHMGGAGTGSQTKLALNTIVGINMAGFIEGLAIAAKSGINLETFVELVQTGGAHSRIAEMKNAKILDRDFSADFSLKHMLKDLHLAGNQAALLQLPTPLLKTVESLYRISLSKGLGDLDMSALVHNYEDWMHHQVSRKKIEIKNTPAADNRRRNVRVPLDIKLQVSIYQWENEGSFSGQTVEAALDDLSESGMQITSKIPLAKDMFIVIHFPMEAELPPITGKIIRIERKEHIFNYGCLISGMAPPTKKKLEAYIQKKIEQFLKT
jgi:3-hydroxyisobutyrate dehydrogenase-like beta-hydroxyacid dehydrogenase